MAVSEGSAIEPDHLPADLYAGRRRAGDDEADCLRQVLAATGGRGAEAARRLGISRATLYRRLARHGIAPADFRRQAQERPSAARRNIN